MIAPELQVSQWFNTETPITLEQLCGKVVLIEAFQMLCPGCISHGLPLAQKVRNIFRPEDVAVLGLHTVFEHHEAMTPVSLKAFLHEYKILFPVGVDSPGLGAMPKTMEAYQMRGTPSTIILDRAGHIRAHHFGDVSDMRLGAEIATLLAEAQIQDLTGDGDTQPKAAGTCDDDGCSI